MKRILGTLVAAAVLAGLAGAIVVREGVYDVSAIRQHTAPTYYLLHYAMLGSVKARARTLRAPALDDPRRIKPGAALYREHCLPCHGAPGIAPAAFALGLRPSPANLVQAGRDWTASEIYWVVSHGLKMTGMPGWKYRLSDAELWDVTAFVKHLPQVSAVEYKQQYDVPSTSVSVAAPAPANSVPGDPQAGRQAIEQYMCITCHRIPGVVGANSLVGPPLDGVATRRYIGGVLPNTPENMIAWLRDPQRVDPLTAMPNLRIREQDVRDIAAYLYTLK